MNIPQTSYEYAPAAAVAGQLASTGFDVSTTSGIAETAIGAGAFVASGTANGQVKIPAASGDVTGKIRGVARYQVAKEPVGPIGGPFLPNFKIGDAVPVLRRGPIWVPVAEADVADDAVPYVIFSGDNAGSIRGTANADAVQPSNGAVRVLKGASAGGLALVELNLP